MPAHHNHRCRTAVAHLCRLDGYETRTAESRNQANRVTWASWWISPEPGSPAWPISISALTRSLCCRTTALSSIKLWSLGSATSKS